ncbi:anti-repressor SinI family protein [Thalassobacillus pellis]|uniref:anti-repressor SinI family protein n=1 Tax=Thalassobacillus pellis TaxID=748008 RepID=UPI00195FAF71|nr:anti-repressor SinI family protein [Thalassobacillus pellis]MBM7551452.1 DNA-binding transcriptional MerR regulator [Thalassobacillus pellis]
MNRNRRNGLLDVEWILLMEEARALGLSKKEVKTFLRAQSRKTDQEKPICTIFRD